MASVTLDREAFARRAEEYYDRVLRAKLEPAHRGEYLYLDVEMGDYELDADKLAAMRRARARHPGMLFYILRVGYPAVGRVGPHVCRRPSRAGTGPKWPWRSWRWGGRPHWHVASGGQPPHNGGGQERLRRDRACGARVRAKWNLLRKAAGAKDEWREDRGISYSTA